MAPAAQTAAQASPRARTVLNLIDLVSGWQSCEWLPNQNSKRIGIRMTAFRFEGMTLTVESVERSIAFYAGKLGLLVEINVT